MRMVSAHSLTGSYWCLEDTGRGRRSAMLTVNSRLVTSLVLNKAVYSSNLWSVISLGRLHSGVSGEAG